MVRVRKLVLAIAAASALTSGMAHALGLGEISLKSALNQPLDAEIELLEVRDLGTGEVIPALAAVEEFNKVGVDRPYFLTDLKFTPVLKPNGKSVIRVTSSKPVREPYLNFLVEVLWPNGRLLREYTVLLDPPLYSPQTAAAATPRLPQAAPIAPAVPQLSERAPLPAPQAEAPVAPAPGLARDSLRDGQYRVGRDDTLWQIAERARPSNAVSVHQTMLAIQELNPDAFFDGNINRLKSGQVLRLPTEAQVRSRSQADALAQVQAQNSAWREGRVVQPVATARQLDATRRSQAGNAPAQAPVEDNLRLVSAATGKSTSGSDNGAAADSKALADKLAVNQESLATTQRENQELKERLGDLQSQLDKLQRLIELKNEQLAKLQGGLASEAAAPVAAAGVAGAEAAVAAAAPQPTAEGKVEAAADGKPQVAAEAQPAADTRPESEAGAEAEAGAKPVEAAAAPVAAEPAAAEPAPAASEQPAPAPVAEAPEPAPVKPAALPVEAEPAYEPSLLDEVLADPLLLAAGGGALALLAGLGLMINARRKAQKPSDDAQGELFTDPGASSAAAVAPVDVPDLGEPLADERAPGAPMPSLKGSDPLGEAEMYSTYGRFTQAAELLRNAINEEPQRADLRLKLMEVCAEMGDREGFVRQEAELGEIGGAQPQIDQLRARYPQILASAAAIGIGAAAAADAFDFSAGAGDDKVAARQDEEFSLDDLTLDDLAPSAAQQAGAASEPVGDFDLSLDDLEAELERELAASPQAAVEAGQGLDELTLEGLGDDLLGLEPAKSDVVAREGLTEPDALDFDLQLDAIELPPAAADVDFGLGETLQAEEGARAPGAAQSDEDLFAELDQLGLDDTLLADEPAPAVTELGDEALFAELDQLGLDDTLLASEPAPAVVESSDEALFAELDQLGLDDALLAAEPQSPVAGGDDESLLAELDQLGLDDSFLLAEADAPQAGVAEPATDSVAVSGEDELLLDLAGLELADPEEGEPGVVPATASLEGLDELELELQALGASSGVEHDLDAAFDEFLAQSGVTEPAAGAELPSFDVAEVAAVPELTGNEDFNFLADTDETATKLELARAYIDMGDADGARDILDEVLKEGNAGQQQEAREMMGRIA